MNIKELPPISVGETAQFFGISSRSVRRLVDRGELRPTRIGGVIAFRWIDVAETAGMDPDEIDPRNPKALLTPQQAAERLDQAPRDVRDLMNRGRLPAVRIGGVTRVRVSDVECLATEHSDAAPC